MSYSPETPSGFKDIVDVLPYLIREFRAISKELLMKLPSELPELHVAPVKLREYMIVAADGTDWNPGAGQGVYAYYAAAWHKLG